MTGRTTIGAPTTRRALESRRGRARLARGCESVPFPLREGCRCRLRREDCRVCCCDVGVCRSWRMRGAGAGSCRVVGACVWERRDTPRWGGARGGRRAWRFQDLMNVSVLVCCSGSALPCDHPDWSPTQCAAPPSPSWRWDSQMHNTQNTIHIRPQRPSILPVHTPGRCTYTMHNTQCTAELKSGGVNTQQGQKYTIFQYTV